MKIGTFSVSWTKFIKVNPTILLNPHSNENDDIILFYQYSRTNHIDMVKYGVIESQSLIETDH